MRTKPLGEHMKEEAAQELVSGKSHNALPSAMRIVLPAEGDMFSIEGEDAVVGDGDAVGVAAEIAQHVLGTAQSLLGIHDPVLAMHNAQQL